jgi:hypothetical protein
METGVCDIPALHRYIPLTQKRTFIVTTKSGFDVNGATKLGNLVWITESVALGCYVYQWRHA